jgi:hypothetical protein
MYVGVTLSMLLSDAVLCARGCSLWQRIQIVSVFVERCVPGFEPSPKLKLQTSPYIRVVCFSILS